MKKIYLFLALAIAVAINANAGYSFNVWSNGKSELYNAVKDNKAFAEDGTYTFSSPLKITDVEGFTIKLGDSEYLTTAITPSNSWKNVKIKDNSNKNNYKNHFKLVPGTYTKVTFDGSTLTFEGTPSQSFSFTIGTWYGSGVVIGNLPNSNFTRNSDNTHVLVFKSPIKVENEEEFKLTYDGGWYGQWNENATNEWIWIGSGDGSIDPKNMKLAPGTYYSATIDECTTEGVKMKFNTYVETTKGLDALLSKSADYVGIMTDIYVSHHWGSYYSICTTEEGSQAKQPNLEEGKEQDIVKWGDNPANFAQLDWFRIADKDNSLVGKQFQAGTIVSVADKKVVKYGTEATPVTFTPSLNIYRPISFTASKEDKEKFFLVTPQDGEKALVRGRYTKVAGNDYLTDNNGRKVAFLNNTSVKFVDRDDQWYEVECYINKNAEIGIYDLVVFGAQVATGVESVETANATVFAANGNINVSSEAQAAIEVYTANGQMVRAINADNASIAVAPGFYLVKVGNQVSKVVVK